MANQIDLKGRVAVVTGAARGFGYAIAERFLESGAAVSLWDMDKAALAKATRALGQKGKVDHITLDVTDEKSISAAVAEAGPIDVLVNNAGIGVVGAFEATPMSTVRDVFATNTFGVMALTQAVIPQLRTRRAGVIVNVTSSVTLAPMPLAAVYTASKIAIEGFTASLAFELEGFGVRVKLVEPGYCPSTRFAENGGDRMQGLIPEAYASFAQPIFEAFAKPALVTRESDVAETVWRAAIDTSAKLRFPAGPDAVALAQANA